MSIECMAYKAHESGSLQGFANLWIPKMGLEIYGCTLNMKDGKRWLSLPSKEYKNKDGETKYQPILRFREKEHLTKFCQLARDAVDEWCAIEAGKAQEEIKDEGVPF